MRILDALAFVLFLGLSFLSLLYSAVTFVSGMLFYGVVGAIAFVVFAFMSLWAVEAFIKDEV